MFDLYCAFAPSKIEFIISDSSSLHRVSIDPVDLVLEAVDEVVVQASEAKLSLDS